MRCGFKLDYSDLVITLIPFPLLMAGIMLLTKSVDWEKTIGRIRAKKVIDCFVYSMTFIFLTYTHHVIVENSLPFLTILFPVLAATYLSISSLTSFTQQFILFGRRNFQWNKEVFPMVLLSLLVGVLMSLSTVNYALYMICPSFYEIPSDLSFAETAFEFIYYSFTLAITYSGSSISVTHVISKIVQMVEICYCYAIIGSVIVQLIDVLKNDTTDL